jgi:hypothetical protein
MSSSVLLQPLPHSTRQQVFTALMNYVQIYVPAPTNPITNKVIPYVTYSQLWESWTDVPPANQPAIFLRRGPQLFESKHAFGVTKLSFKCSLWIYFRTDGFKINPYYPDQVTDPLIDGIEQAFQSLTPTPQRNTLNNTVYHCWVEGQVFSDPGLVDDQGVIVVPINILL